MKEPLLQPQPVWPATETESFPHVLSGTLPLLRPDEVARITGWSRRKIYELCEGGLKPNEPPLLEAHGLPGRSVQRKQITRRSVAALLLRGAHYDPRDFPHLLKLTLSSLTVAQLREVGAAVEDELQRLAPAPSPETPVPNLNCQNPNSSIP